jgi:flavin reductase (DIM6/NTAB) family NADH-FMN oxidoreductase RutF
MNGLDKDTADLTEEQLYFLLTGLVVPRPIAWVSTVNAAGGNNLAPFSYFSAVTSNPPIVQVTMTNNPSAAAHKVKDTVRNIRETLEFVVNIVDEDLLTQVNMSSVDCPADVDEFALCELSPARSSKILPPRVAASKAALECRLHRFLPIGDSIMVFGDVVHIHVSPDIMVDGRVNTIRLKPVGRLSGPAYVVVDAERQLVRPRWKKTSVKISG